MENYNPKWDNLRKGGSFMEVKAKLGNEGATYTAEYDFGSNLQEAVAKFGEAVVYSNYIHAAKISIQAAMRRWMKAGLSEKDVADKVKGIVLGVQAERVVDTTRAFLNRFEKMSPEEKNEILARLKELKRS